MNVVQKYGGTSLDSIEKIRAVAKHIASFRKEGDGIVIVASAMGGIKDELVSQAKQVGENIPKRELDALLATGEQKTVALLAIALQNLRVPAVSMTGFQSGFITTNQHSKARIKEINTERTEQFLKEGKVVVLAGFQGISEDGDITTLGGGSDTTAVAIAAQLGWDCEIYTDVDAIFSIDPKIYPKAKKLDRITYEEMMELASGGAAILETRSVELAKKYNVKLYIGKSLESDKRKGTYVMNDTFYIEEMPVTGISISDDCSIYSLQGMKNDGIVIASLFQLMADHNINVDMISKQIYGDNLCTVSFSCTDAQSEELDAVIENSDILDGITLKKQTNLSIISLVGVGMATSPGVASKVFAILAREGITYYQITTSEISISVTVNQDEKIKAVIALCEAFGL
ncbi:MAG: aspartate kinase [Eubacteriales bacterium]|nr:aspartate kinase [Eubacteriales bacterium]MDD3200153.1 aspartate kinase [Eubacteriales bacterium]MDD4629079.1 aspartate kinase [Eubacteriales bacterium]